MIHYNIRNIFFATPIVFGLFASGFASCSDESRMENNLEAQTRALAINIPLASSDIPDTDLKVLVIDQDGKNVVGEVEIDTFESQKDSSQLIHGFISADCNAINNDKLNCKLVVLGNCEKVPETTAAIRKMKFEANPTHYPMYGAVSVEKTLDSRFEVMCAEVPLLYSGAMITVQLGEFLKNEGISLGDVILKNANKYGYIAPNSATIYNTATDLDQSKIFNPDDSAKEDIKLQKQANGAMIGFVPECTAPTGAPLEITVQFIRDNKTYSGNFGNKLYLKDYATNKPFDIIRGNHYIFTIRRLQTDVDLEVKVEKWNEVSPEDVIFK